MRLAERIPQSLKRRPSLHAALSFFVVAVCTGFVASQLRLDLVFMDSTAAGGDMGAHVWAPQYFVDHLLPHGRLTGWSPDWYAGFPALTFYFPLPTFAVALLDIVLPGTVAFKVVTILGSLTLPLCTYAFGRLAGLPFPVPACLAAFTVPFLFSNGFSILGGNIASMLAGEFSFSFALSIAMLLLGIVANGVRTGRYRWLAALLFGAVIMSHILPTIFAFTGSVLIVAIATVSNISQGRDAMLKPIKWAIPVGVTGGLLSAWWLIPFVANSPYMNDMGWEKIGTGTESGLKVFDKTIVNYSDALFAGPMLGVFVVAAAGVLLTIFFMVVDHIDGSTRRDGFRRDIAIVLALLATLAAIGFVVMPQGRLWNARLLPFWYLCLYLLAGLLVGEIGRGLSDAVRRLKGSNFTVDVADGLKITAPLVALAVGVGIVVPTISKPSWSPFDTPWHTESSTRAANYVPSWAKWNFSGYDGKDSNGEYYKPAYPEFESVIEMLDNTGRTLGCGRVMWEYEKELDRFGTPMALMRAPSLTRGCMASMEGLYFESSATVPYHFLNQRELSLTGSAPMREMPYAAALDVPSGINKMQLMGVKYYLAVSPQAQQQASYDARLTLVASVPAAPDAAGASRTWNLYEIADTEIVTPLSYLPNVMTDEKSIQTWRDGKVGKKHSAREAWLENALAWYDDAGRYDVPLAASGPSGWPRVSTALDSTQRVPVEPARVTYIATGDDRITFKVDRVGVPVVVKASYFPNWKVSGASGPYRVTPNQMVVVPTSETVSLHYGYSLVDYLSGLGTLVGLGAVVWIWRRDRSAPEQVEQQPGVASGR